MQTQGVIYIHRYQEFEGKSVESYWRESPDLWAAFLAQRYSGYAGGYYRWRDPDGRVREKFLFFAPVMTRTADGRRLTVAATSYEDEFLGPLRASQDLLHGSPLLIETFRRHHRGFRWTLYSISLLFATVLIGIALLLGSRASGSISALKRAFREVDKGNLRVSVPWPKPPLDEVSELMAGFNRMVEALRHSTISVQEWEHTFQMVRDPMLVVDEGHRIVRANKAAEEVFGPLKGSRCYEALWKEEDPCNNCPLKGKGGPSSQQRSLKGRVFLCSSNPLEGEGLRGAVCLLKDITDLKEREERLGLEKARFETLVAHCPFAIALIARDGRYLYLNPKFTEILGYSLQDISTGGDWFRLAFPDPDLRRDVISTWKEDMEKISSVASVERTYPVRCKDGSTKEIRGITLLLPDGNYLVIYEDITERKRLEAELLHAQKMEAIGMLAGGIAHEFNNLLTTIRGFTELLMLKMPEGHQELKHIERAALRGAELTKQLLTFSRKAPSTVPVEVDINQEVEKVCEVLKRTFPKNIQIELRLSPDLWSVKANSGQIEQVLLNLAMNAKDAMPEGGSLIIETENVLLEGSKVPGLPSPVKPGPYVHLKVSDTGCGMTEEIKARIFEPFFTTKGIGEGTGLGLSIVYGIVKDHGGYITCTSRPTEGTTFEIWWPVLWRDEDGQERDGATGGR
ncbi:TPA: PAS domain S-box protein [Candidatus Bipolaricaulota bacterium]|nr:PAS domain S-box protein [Candidatus Bipolaricaulota bacterium]